MKGLFIIVILAVTLLYIANQLQQADGYYQGSGELSSLQSIHANPGQINLPYPPAEQVYPLPTFKVPPPSFAIIPQQPGDAKQPSYMVKFVDKDLNIKTECLKYQMANSIPGENIMPSSLSSGEFRLSCPPQNSLDYKPWPF